MIAVYLQHSVVECIVHLLHVDIVRATYTYFQGNRQKL